MKLTSDSALPGHSAAHERRRIAQRVADGHRGLDDSSLLAFVSGSVVDDLADERSDVDMSVVLAELPTADVLQAAAARVGGTPWFWSQGELAEGGAVVAFHVDGIEVQIGYATHAALQDQVDELLLRHNPDTPLHKLAEGILKAEPLFGQRPLQALQHRLAAFPPELALAMGRHFVATPTPWRALSQIVHRDAALWCREIFVDASYRLLGLLAAVNLRYFTRFQVKRMHRFAAGLAHVPPDFADRVEAVLKADPLPAARQLLALEAQTFDLVSTHLPAVDLTAARARHAHFKPD